MKICEIEILKKAPTRGSILRKILTCLNEKGDNKVDNFSVMSKLYCDNKMTVDTIKKMFVKKVCQTSLPPLKTSGKNSENFQKFPKHDIAIQSSEPRRFETIIESMKKVR